MKTKLLRTYESLKNHIPYGIHSFDLMRESGTTRCAARVNDLKKQGYIIESKRETLHGVDGCRYILKGKSDSAKPIEPIKPTRWEFNSDTNTATPIYA